MKGNTDTSGEAPFMLGVGWNMLFAGERTGWSNYTVAATITNITPAAWHHAAAAFVSSTRQLTLYLDGAQVAQGTLGARSVAGNGTPVEIGRNGNGGATWRGKIDDVRLWNLVRTGAQISSSYRAELSTTPAGLVANWKFNEGTGLVAADGTVEAENANLLGTAAWSTDVGNIPPAPDTTPPQISAISASSVTAASALIGWSTDEASDSQVDYGPTSAYGTSTTLNAALVTSHSQQLSGLSAGTTYHYRVRSRDGSGNLATSGDQTFTTAAPDTTPPLISAVAASGVSNTAATIGWTTDEPADTQLDYGTTTAYGSSSTLNPALVTAHSQTLAGLTPNTLYHYRVRSRDAAGNLATSGDQTFSTTNAAPANSLLLNGAGAAEAPNAAELNITADWTIEAWFKDESPGGYNHDFTYIVLKGNTDQNAEAPLMLGIGWNTLFAGERTNWSNFTVAAPIGALSTATWHHAAATFTAATRTITLYLDGVQVAQGVIGARSTAGNSLPVEIGRNGNGAAAWRGKLDDVRIWNVVRTAAEISANYRTLGSAPASLVASWQFDEGSGATAADASALPENATLVSGAGWSSDVHP
jgi:hypothetical protein